MTTREAYFKAYMHTENQLAMLFYIFEQHGFKRMGNTQWMNMCREEHEDNIKQMQYIEQQRGFLFWCISDEGEKYGEELKRTSKVEFNHVAFITK